MPFLYNQGQMPAGVLPQGLPPAQPAQAFGTPMATVGNPLQQFILALLHAQMQPSPTAAMPNQLFGAGFSGSEAANAGGSETAGRGGGMDMTGGLGADSGKGAGRGDVNY